MKEARFRIAIISCVQKSMFTRIDAYVMVMCLRVVPGHVYLYKKGKLLGAPGLSPLSLRLLVLALIIIPGS